MDGDTKSYHIAVYMIHRQSEAVIAKSQADEMKQKSRKGKKGGKGSSR